MGAILTIGGAAGLASIGINVVGYTISSTWTALGISSLIGIGSGLASYSCEIGFDNPEDWNLKGFGLAGLSGGLKGVTTFTTGYFGGKFGAFDKIFFNPILKGSYLNSNITYDVSKAILAAIYQSGGRNFLTNISSYAGEFLTKMIFVSSVASALRALIDKIFDYFE